MPAAGRRNEKREQQWPAPLGALPVGFLENAGLEVAAAGALELASSKTETETESKIENERSSTATTARE